MIFNDFDWHDAIMKNVIIDRSNPGVSDTIVLQIQFPTEEDISDIEFEEVYYAQMHLNFGVIAEETIAEASELGDGNSYLLSKNPGLEAMINNVPLKVYRFAFNSTGSVIEIIAAKFSCQY